MAQVTVVARVVAEQNASESLKAELLKLVPATRQEQGCIAYRLHQDNDDQGLFLFYETWENEACLDRHLNSVHFKAYIAATEGMIKEKTVSKMTEI